MSKKRDSALPPIPRSARSDTNEDRLPNELADNPFKLPSDDKIFRLREEEKKKKMELRELSMNMSIWEKSKSEVSSRAQRLKELIGETKVTTLNDLSRNALEESMKMVAPHHQEKERNADFIAKKREMFLVQMSLDTKREEIRKLEEKAQMKEEALLRSEQMLEEDAMRFDAFLKENDKKAHDAIKKAEEETKRKQEKTQEIKRLTQQIQALNSEMSKHKEALDDCLRYKKFLDMLTPPEWFEQHRKKLEDDANKIKMERYQEKMKLWEKNRRKLIEQHRKEAEAKKDTRKDKNRRLPVSGKNPEDEEDDEQEFRLVIPPPPKLEEEYVEIANEDPPMYFVNPQQLMDIFSALEEQNLFLIQNSQETERTLEELQHAFKETKLTMDSRTAQLNKQIDELKDQITSEEARVKTLLSKRMASTTSATSGVDVSATAQTQQEKEKLLNDLNIKVREVYHNCGFDSLSKPSTLFMLSQLESKLESLLSDIEKLPPEYVIKVEKEKEKRRRETKRKEQQALQEKMQEERNRRAIERSMQAPKKRFGRQVMYRSKPIRKENKNTGNEQDDDKNDDEIKFLT